MKAVKAVNPIQNATNMYMSLAIVILRVSSYYLLTTCYSSRSDTFWNVPENKDQGSVVREEWYLRQSQKNSFQRLTAFIERSRLETAQW